MVEALPETEKPFATVVWFQIQNLARGLEVFAADLKLYDFSIAEREHKLGEMRRSADARSRGEGPSAEASGFPTSMSAFIACRDATLALWNFMQAAKAIRANLDGSPTLRATVNVKAIDDALAQFHRGFPRMKDMMDAVRHQAELSKTPKKLGSNTQVTGRNLVTENLNGRTFFTTAFGGDEVSFDISQASLAALEQIVNQIYDAFPERPRAATAQVIRPS